MVLLQATFASFVQRFPEVRQQMEAIKAEQAAEDARKADRMRAPGARKKHACSKLMMRRHSHQRSPHDVVTEESLNSYGLVPGFAAHQTPRPTMRELADAKAGTQEGDDILNSAATVVQKVWRGFADRKHMTNTLTSIQGLVPPMACSSCMASFKGSGRGAAQSDGPPRTKLLIRSASRQGLTMASIARVQAQAEAPGAAGPAVAAPSPASATQYQV